MMKKAISLILALALLFSCCPVLPQQAKAATEGTAQVTKGSGNGVLDSDTTVVVRPTAKNVLGTNGTYFATLSDAIAAAQAGGTLTLCKDMTENVTIRKNVRINLNGFDIIGTVTVANGYVLYCFDSQTDDYTVNDAASYGKITKVVGSVQGLPEASDGAEDGYLMITEADGVSFHRVNLQVTAMTLRASQAGVYYKSMFAGDELVAQNVSQFGVALSVHGVPTANDPTSVRSWFKNFQAGINGGDTNSTLLYGIMKSDRTAENNAARAAMPIYGRAYILTNDGRYLFGAAVSRTLQEQVEEVDAMWSELSAQQQAELTAMYQTYAGVMQNWNLPNLQAVMPSQTAMLPGKEETAA